MGEQEEPAHRCEAHLTLVEQVRLHEQLQAGIWGAGMGIWEYDFPRARTTWFSSWCDRVEVDARDGWDARVHPDDVREVQRRFSEHVVGKLDEFEVEYRIRDKRGQWRWLFDRARVVERAADGSALRMFGVCVDIDARKQAELDLLRSRRRLELALESACGSMWELDSASSSPRHNEFFDRLLGLPGQDGAGKSDFWSRVHAEDLPRVRDCMRRTLAGEQELYEAEYRVRHADGSWRWVLDRGRAPERDSAGRAQRLVGFVVEITDRVRAEEERRSLEREATQIAHREQQRIGNDLHDGLGQDLTGIALMLRGVLGQLRAEGSRACQDVEDVITYVNSAIESTRALARGLSPLSAREGLVAALQSLAAHATARFGIRVRFETGCADPLALSETEATHLYRIAQEALTNAVRHSGAAQVRINLWSASNRLVLQVSDDGRGFPKSAPSAAGLGLKIMRHRAQTLRGELTLDSGASGGALVRLTCPLEPSATQRRESLLPAAAHLAPQS